MRKINRTDTELILPTKEVQMVIIFRTILGGLHDKLTGKQSVSNKINIFKWTSNLLHSEQVLRFKE
jgi:hypothetical protein